MEILRTARLSLRTWRQEDIADLVRLSEDPAVHELLPGPWTAEKARVLVDTQDGLYERHGTCYFAAALRDSGALAGFVGLKYQDFDQPFAPCYELGWLLGRRYWERGYASEGVRAGIAHPALPPGHRLSRHVLYRIRRAQAFARRRRVAE